MCVGDEVSMAGRSGKDRSPVKPKVETQQKSPNAHPIDGRVPTEASFNVMKMVIGATGTEAKTSGKSTTNQLRSLRTEPSLKLLKTTSWRNFFDAEDINTDTAKPSATANPGRSPSPTSPPTMIDRKGATFSQSVSAPFNLTSTFTSTAGVESDTEGNKLSRIYQSLTLRIEVLWRELKIPSGDVKFYKETLCSGKPRSLDHCRELARYIKTLTEHRQAILRVLHTIQVREILVSHFHEVLLALNRKYIYRRSYESTQGGGDRDKVVKGISVDANLAWKEEIVEVLKELQVQTVEVVQAIQHWRRGLWRPHTFMYKGQDYIAKMKQDLSVLGSEVYMRQLESIPICRDDLVCILFHDNEVDDVMNGTGTIEQRQQQQQQQWQFKTELASSSTVPLAHAQLRDYFLSGDYRRDELDVAAKVIYEDAKLQRAIKTEKDALLAKRVFIPTLKVDIIKAAEPRRVNPFHNKYHAHIKRPATADGSRNNNHHHQTSDNNHSYQHGDHGGTSGSHMNTKQTRPASATTHK